MGGEYAGPTQDRLLAVAAELGVATFPTYDTGMNVLHFNGKRGTYAGAIPRINPLVLADIGMAQARLESLAKKVPTDAPWNAASAERWDGQTFETWARRNTVSLDSRSGNWVEVFRGRLVSVAGTGSAGRVRPTRGWGLEGRRTLRR